MSFALPPTMLCLRILLIQFVWYNLSQPLTFSDKMLLKIQKEGYPAERHFVETKDGYILGLHRIPNRRGAPPKRKVMLMMHGMGSSSPAYIALGPKKSAAFFFSDAGYDIWMTNARGNTLSRNHTTLDPDNQPEFWDFSWHEIGQYDLPAAIDYILKTTNTTKLDFIGHSQGVTCVMVMLCELPEYNEKINTLHAMTPAVLYVHNSFNYLDALFDVVNLTLVEDLVKTLGFLEIAPYGRISNFADVCSLPLVNSICKNIYFMIFGPSDDFDSGLTSVIKDHVPGGVGYRSVLHYAQIIINGGNLKHYVYGPAKNVQKYGIDTPPEYNLSNVKTRIHLMYGTNDYITQPENVPLVVAKLGRNIVAVSRFEGYNHADFTYGKHVEAVQRKILRVLKGLE